MRLRTYNIAPPGGWSYVCQHCSGQHFGAATFQGLLAQVQHHFRDKGHVSANVLMEVETFLCNRIPRAAWDEFVTDLIYIPGEPRTNTILLLGRYGDIVNLLPYAYCLSRTTKVQWLVNRAFAGILDGVSYVTPIEIPQDPDCLRQAITLHYDLNPRVAQCWQNPDQRHLTPSFATESWRLAGGLDEWGKWPLVFDRRSPEREAKLLSLLTKERPLVLVATESVSSPYTNKARLLESLSRLPARIIDLTQVKAEKPQDLLALIEEADCLVTIDSLYLHLARACYTPVVALLSNGWLGSPNPPQTAISFPYNYDVDRIVSSVHDILQSKPQTYVVTGNHFGQEQRHSAAQATWGSIFYPAVLPRSSKDLGDTRSLPFVKDILNQTLLNTHEDVIILTNDDVTFKNDTVSRVKEHAGKFLFGCARRALGHQGREIYWFKRTWLQSNIATMPDVILGAPRCDFVLAKWMRAKRGIVTTEQNLHFDMPPVELPAGLIHHEEHVSSWLRHQNSASAKHNEILWRSN